MIQEDRALWKYIVFGFLTCGIYNFYFIYKMAQDVNEMCADDGKKTSGLVVFCLLYTSPSPRDGLLSRMPSSA